MFVFQTSCGQNQANVPKIISSTKDTIKYNRTGLSESQLKEATNSKVPVSMVRNVRQARNGDILIASYLGVFRYDGTSFTNISGEISWPTFWDVLEDRKGNIWFASQDSGVYYYNGKSFQHFTTRMGLPVIWRFIFMKIGPEIFGSDQAVTMGNLFEVLATKDGFPSNSIRLLLEDKTGKLWFGAQGENLFVYDGRHLPY
jgi:ligand-binding sensor domain-containing protein